MDQQQLKLYAEAARTKARALWEWALARPILTGAAAALVISLILAACAWRGVVYWYAERPIPVDTASRTLEVRIVPGTSARVAAAQLVEAGLKTSADQIVAAMRIHGALSIHAGRYRFTDGMTMKAVIDKLATGAVEAGSIRIADGMTIWQLRKAVESNPDITVTTAEMTEGELLTAIGASEGSAEGLFAPETYKFNSGTTDVAVYRMAYQRQKGVLQTLWNKRAEGLKLKTPYEALILASIIEKETAHPEDRYLVSSVFHNRLRVRMPLQTDPTIIYSLGENFAGNLRKKDLQRPGPYNTYRNYGLPPTPIAMPGYASIDAALNPAKSKFLYFVARGDGTTQFSRFLEHHNQAVNKYQRNRR